MAETKSKTKKALVPQPHGGAILTGGVQGNRGGRGAVPSLLRDQLEESFRERVPVLERIADGVPMVRVEIPLSELVGHVSCPDCDKAFAADDSSKARSVIITAKQSARPSDQIKAVDTIAKYGPGEKQEISLVSPDVKNRLFATVALVSEKAPQILEELEVIWST